MHPKFNYFKLTLLIITGLFLNAPAYCTAYDFGVAPPASGLSHNGPTTGLVRTISNALPSDWKEDGEYKGFSNSLFYDASQDPYVVKIWLDPSSDPMLLSNLEYFFTYVYMYYGTGATNEAKNGAGKGTKSNYQKYVHFRTAPTEVYSSTTFEAPPFSSFVQAEIQFKYGLLIPNNQLAGTYNGTIKYSIEAGVTTLNGQCPISVVVGDYFRLSVDRGSIDFEKMKPGETKDNVPVEGIIVTSKTNVGNPWYLKISNDSPLSSGPYVIPNSSFIWYGWTDGAGTWYGTGANQMTFVPGLMYSSGANEGNNLPNGTNSHLKFKLTVPKGQPGGKYLSNVKLTLTE